jgi:hypothetical protein
MKKERTQIRAVARRMAAGHTLEDTLASFYITDEMVIRSWKLTVKGDLFKKVLQDFVDEIEVAYVEDTASDPEWQKLQVLRGSAIHTIGHEVGNYNSDEGASSGSRISAAKQILTMTGSRTEDEQRPIILAALGEDLLREIFSRGVPGSQPQIVNG